MFVLHNNPWGLHFRALVLLVVCETLATHEHGLHGFFQTHCTSLTPSRLLLKQADTWFTSDYVDAPRATVWPFLSFFLVILTIVDSLEGTKLSKESSLAWIRVSCSNSLIQEPGIGWCILTTQHNENILICNFVEGHKGLQVSPHIILHHLYIVSAEVSLSCLQDVLYVFWHYFILGNS